MTPDGRKDSDAYRNSPFLGRQIGPYVILSLLGAGGMGEVYRAKDQKLAREVAIKVLPAAFVHDFERLSRFRREAQMLAALNHPNIATVYGFEESQDLHCLVMELVPGSTLAERVTGGALPTEEALRICCQIANALEAAHRRGITHRDIKPANIKVTPEGTVKVLDFGLAKPLAGPSLELDPSDAPTLTNTQSGIFLGTPAYASPEQLREESADQRSDIWSFGCVMYEVLAGRRPFAGTSIPEVIASVLKAEPDWQVFPPATPGKAFDLVRRCLQKDPNKRLPEIALASAELKAAMSAPTTMPISPTGGAITSLAVLPFVNSSTDPQMEYLGDGLTESIIFSLSQLPQLRVIARSTVFRHKGSDDAQAIGRLLGVQAVVTGRVLQRGEMLFIRAELTDVENGWQLWGAQYRRRAQDIFATEEEIATEISERLCLKLAPEKQNVPARRYTENVEAYHLYLKGRFYSGKRTDEGLYKALQCFRQAVETDPTYALAYAGLADTYVPLAFYCHLAPCDALPKARAAANKALEIDSDLVVARSVLAGLNYQYDWDLSAAERQYREVIALDPLYPRARQGLADCLSLKGRFKEAAAEIRKAVDLDPLALNINAAVVMTSYYSRQYDNAIEQGLRVADLDSSFLPTHLYLGLAYQQKGLFAQAADELEQARRLSNNSTLMTANLGGVFAFWGKREKAHQILSELDQMGGAKYVPHCFVAAIHVGLRDNRSALSCLERAVNNRDTQLLHCLLADARFDALRGDTRFDELVRQVRPS